MNKHLFKIIIIFISIAFTAAFSFWLKSSRSPQLFGKCIHCVQTHEKIVALTFDDGPSDPYTSAILAVLRHQGVKATFFLLGQNVANYPGIVQSIYQEGHEIGNHSYSHQQLIFKTPGFVRDEIEKTDRLIRQAGYQGKIYFRAPYGRKLFILPWILSRQGREHILFDVIPDDWDCPGVPVIVERVLKQVKPGSIILCHDGGGDRTQTVEATAIIIEKLKAAGYRFVTISELLRAGKISG